MDDYSSDIFTTGFLPINGPAVSGINETPDDWDFFRMELDPFAEYSIVVLDETPGAPPLKLVYFYDSQGNYFSTSYENDDDHYFTVSNGGRYFVGIQGNGLTGPYSIQLLELDAGGSDFDTATPAKLNGNRFFRSSISVAGDDDWFTVELKANTSYVFNALGVDTGHGTLANPALRARDPFGKLLDGDDNSGIGRNAQVMFTSTVAGQYRFQIFSADPNGTGSYHVLSAQLDDYDALPGFNNGQLVLNSSGTLGVIDYPGDRDWFAVTLKRGDLYNFISNDVAINLYMPSGVQLASSNGASTLPHYVSQIDSVVYVEVVGTPLTEYTLQANDADDFPADIGTASVVVPRGTPRFGRLSPGDSDWHRVELFGGGQYEFLVEPSDHFDREFEGGLKLSLFDGLGQLVAASPGNLLSFLSPDTGSYYVAVEGADATSNGHYDVSANSIDVPIPSPTFTDNMAALKGALDYSGDVDEFSIELTAGEGLHLFRTSFPFDQSESESVVIRRPDGSTFEMISRRSDRTSFDSMQMTANESGIYTVIENSVNDVGPGGYHYALDRNHLIPDGAFPEFRLTSDAYRLVRDNYSPRGERIAFEVVSNVELTYGSAMIVPAMTLVVLSTADFETLELPVADTHRRIELSIRSQGFGGKWTSWERLTSYDAGLPTTLVPELNDLPPKPSSFSEPVLSFSFAQTLPDYFSPGEIDGFQPLTDYEMGRVQRAHGRWRSDLSLLKLVRKTNDDHSADIVIFKADIADDVMVFTPSADRGRDIVINANSPVMQDLTPGSEGFFKIIQAVGKAIGLSEQPGLDGQFTVMGDHMAGFPFPETPLLWDIGALQAAYGRGFYLGSVPIDVLSDERPMRGMLTGDRLDASSSGWGVHIDMRPAETSHVLHPTQSYSLQTPTNSRFFKTIVGSGSDDWLSGSDSNDRISGGDGNDRLYGRQGIDVLNGGLGHDVYMFAPGDGLDTIEGDTAGFDTLRLDGLHNMSSLDDDFTFERLGGDLLIRLEWDSENYPNSDRVLLKDYANVANRVESLLWTNPDGAVERVSLISVFEQVTQNRQRFAVTGNSDAYGLLVAPV